MDRPNHKNYVVANRSEQSRPVAATLVPAEPIHKPKTRIRTVSPDRKWWKPLLIFLAVTAVLWLTYGYIHTKNQLQQLSNPQTAGQSETQQLVNRVSKLVELPAGETPALYTVNDASKLKSQAFFSAAQNGDKVLNYSKANKAVLYRPSTNKVIEYSTPNLSSVSSTPSK
jgi:hypothetical protein